MTKLVLVPSYILHTRPFSETSLIAEVWTKEQGRVSILVKGAKRPKSRLRGLVTPFMGLHVSAVGKSELLTCTGIEIYKSHCLHGKALMSGLYLNELLYKSLPKSDPFEDLFDQYEQLIETLLSPNLDEVQWAMRVFEYHLLQALGYGLDLTRDYTNQPIQADQLYQFQAQAGLVKVANDVPAISGAAVLALSQGKFEANHLKSYKWLMQSAITDMLTGQKINTRDIARSIGEMS